MIVSELEIKKPMRQCVRGGCLFQWLWSPFTDMDIVRIEGPKDSVERSAELYAAVFGDPPYEARVGTARPVSKGDWAIIILKWTDEG